MAAATAPHLAKVRLVRRVKQASTLAFRLKLSLSIQASFLTMLLVVLHDCLSRSGVNFKGGCTAELLRLSLSPAGVAAGIGLLYLAGVLNATFRRQTVPARRRLRAPAPLLPRDDQSDEMMRQLNASEPFSCDAVNQAIAEATEGSRTTTD